MKLTNYYIPLYNNKLYHIYNRANGKEKLFYRNENYYYFLRQYNKYLSGFLDTFAYCLLPNHFHLLVRVTTENPENISERFRQFFISYSMSINKQEQRKGNLLQRGFKRKLIEDERYFYNAVYYIHSNPVHHKLRNDFRDYPYSSYSYILQGRTTALLSEEVMAWFGGREQFINYHEQIRAKYFDEHFLIEEYT